VTRFPFNALPVPRCPWLIVQGEADEVVDPAAVYAFVAATHPPPSLVRVPATGHFFHRKLIDLRGIVQDQVRADLPPLTASDQAVAPGATPALAPRRGAAGHEEGTGGD
jgi:pimeloyl-ACP methyl ester carboxylesterase